MNYGYARVSTNKQEHLRQKEILKDCNIDKMFFEVISGGKEAKKRPVFSKMCAELREGDTIYFAEMSRFGRSTQDLLLTSDELVKKYKVNLKFVKEGITLMANEKEDDPYSKVVFTILAALCNMERDLIRQRVNDGLKAAREEGRIGGRRKDTETHEKVLELIREGGYTQKQIAEKVGCTQGNVSLIKKMYITSKIDDDIYDI